LIVPRRSIDRSDDRSIIDRSIAHLAHTSAARTPRTPRARTARRTRRERAAPLALARARHAPFRLFCEFRAVHQILARESTQILLRGRHVRVVNDDRAV
jgi:hypothetical protein